MASPTVKLTAGDVLQLKEAVYLFNVQLERFTPPMSQGIHYEKLKTGLDKHLFFGRIECQSRKEFDRRGQLTDDEYWKMRRSNLCHLANVGLALFLTTLMSKEIQIGHDGSVAARIGVCHENVNLLEMSCQTLHFRGLETRIGANHKWCVVDLKNGSRIKVDLAAPQYNVFHYDRGYPCVIEPSSISPSLYPEGAVPSYDVVDQVSEMAFPLVNDAHRAALATLEAVFDLLQEDVYKQVEDEATGLLFQVFEIDTMQIHREEFQSTKASLFLPEDCNWCHHPKAKYTCCGTVRYCGVFCQKKDRKNHRPSCTKGPKKKAS